MTQDLLRLQRWSDLACALLVIPLLLVYLMAAAQGFASPVMLAISGGAVVANGATWAVGRTFRRHVNRKALIAFELLRAFGLAAVYILTYPRFIQDPNQFWFFAISPASVLALPILALQFQRPAWSGLAIFIILPTMALAARTERDLTDPTIPLAGTSSCESPGQGASLLVAGRFVGNVTQECDGSFCSVADVDGVVAEVDVGLIFVVEHRTLFLNVSFPGTGSVPDTAPIPINLPNTYALGENQPGGSVAVSVRATPPGDPSAPAWGEGPLVGAAGGGEGTVTLEPDGSGSLDVTLQPALNLTASRTALSVRGRWRCSHGLKVDRLCQGGCSGPPTPPPTGSREAAPFIRRIEAVT